MRALALTLLAVILTVGAVLAGPSPASVGPTVLCGTCHDQPETWGAKTSVHAPVAAEECLACHNPHAARHGSLMRRTGARTCFSCHEDLAVAVRSTNAHAAVTSGEACLTCHDPHASDRPQLLKDSTLELCAICHEGLVRGGGVTHPHAPVAEGECLTCHDPHAGARPYLASADEPDLCTACHEASDPALRRAHKEISIAGAKCSGCHSPHGGRTANLIRPEVHAPFAEGSCEVCHEAESDLASLAESSGDFCTACHEPRVKGHAIPEGRACVSCHTSHASSTAALMDGREKYVCLSCHENIAVQRVGAVGVHPPFAGTQDCTVCHELHTGQTVNLLKKRDAQGTCTTCHASHAEFSHPMGQGIMDPTHPGHYVGCLSCHDPHGTSFRAILLADPRRDLCVRCHTSDGSVGATGHGATGQ